MTSDEAAGNGTKNAKHAERTSKGELLCFERSPSGEKLLRLSDRKHGRRIVEKYTLDEIKRAFADA